MDRWLGKTAVVTGAASGIGEAITHALLQNGVNVAALDVQKERLAKLEAECKRKGFPGKLHAIRCDVSREDEIDAAFSQIETLGGVDIMVNNAGVCEYTSLIESDRKAYEKILNINVLAFAVCANKAVCLMRKRNVEGHIFNINSVAGHCMPSMLVGRFNIYPVSKHASVTLTQLLRHEIAQIKAPIRVTDISPGTVKTNITAHSDYFEKVLHIHPADIADGLIYALGARPEVQITQLIIQHTGEIP